MPAGEIGLYRDTVIGPLVREADGGAGRGHHRSGADRNLEAIVHQAVLPQRAGGGAEPASGIGITRNILP
jgi:hypothetical protein